MRVASFGDLIYRRFLRPIAFVMDPERAHYRTMALFGWGLKMPFFNGALKKSLHVAAQPSDEIEVPQNPKTPLI